MIILIRLADLGTVQRHISGVWDLKPGELRQSPGPACNQGGELAAVTHRLWRSPEELLSQRLGPPRELTQEVCGRAQELAFLTNPGDADPAFENK